MPYIARCLIVAAIILTIVQERITASDWDRYKECTLAQVTAENTDLLEGDYSVNARDHSIKVRVMFTGESRAINKDKKKLIEMWVKTFQMKPEVATLFQKELLFKEGDTSYWLPVQSDVVPYFFKEVQPGGSVWLYAQLWGSAKGQYVVVVNEFDVIKGEK